MDHNSDLLRPSLSADGHSAVSIYTLRTAFLSTFFGGPVAGAAIALIDSYRLRRLAVDWPIALIAVVPCAALGWVEAHDGWRPLNTVLGPGADIYVSRAVNIIFFGLVYAMHRTYYKSMSVLGITPPNGLPVGIGAIVAGVLSNAAMLAVFSK